MLSDYLINFIIYVQPLFFIWMFETIWHKEWYNIDLRDYGNDFGALDFIFYSVSSLFLIFVFVFNINYAFYTNFLLIQYVLLTMFAYYYLRKADFTFLYAICFSFLLVFLNSYVWESVLHFTVYNINIRELFKIREIYHLIVIYFLSRYFYVSDKKMLSRNIKILLFINFLFCVIYIEVLQRWIGRMNAPYGFILTILPMALNRLISLIFILDIFNNALELKDEKDIKWWFYPNNKK